MTNQDKKRYDYVEDKLNESLDRLMTLEKSERRTEQRKVAADYAVIFLAIRARTIGLA